MTQGFGGFLLLGADWGCGCGDGCMVGGSPMFKCVLSANHDENQKIKLNQKQKYPKLL